MFGLIPNPALIESKLADEDWMISRAIIERQVVYYKVQPHTNIKEFFGHASRPWFINRTIV